MPLLLVAAAALIDGQGRVLVTQRPAGKALAGYWEFPGGKLEDGESPEAALVRELAEEIDVEVEAAALEPFTFASHTYADFHLLMPLYLCRRWNRKPRPREVADLAFVAPAQLRELTMPPADEPLVKKLQAVFAG